MQYLGKTDLAKLFRTAHETNRVHHLAMLVGFYGRAYFANPERARRRHFPARRQVGHHDSRGQAWQRHHSLAAR